LSFDNRFQLVSTYAVALYSPQVFNFLEVWNFISYYSRISNSYTKLAPFPKVLKQDTALMNRRLTSGVLTDSNYSNMSATPQSQIPQLKMARLSNVSMPRQSTGDRKSLGGKSRSNTYQENYQGSQYGERQSLSRASLSRYSLYIALNRDAHSNPSMEMRQTF
jgi:hypothetical protein